MRLRAIKEPISQKMIHKLTTGERTPKTAKKLAKK
jgi:hypothetical protein